MRPKIMLGVLGLFCATMFAACQAPQPLDAAETPPEALKLEAQQPAKKPAAKPAQPRKAVAAAPAATTSPAVNATVKSESSADATPIVSSRPMAATQDDDQPISTTITGCLVRDDGVFQLKDTDGQHAPKARSWKSGFIKRGSATVDVLDAGDGLNLGSHVGHRVVISGTLTDRDMQARTLRELPERCD